MCGGMVDIQSPTLEIRRGKKEERRRKKKPQVKNIKPGFMPVLSKFNLMEFRLKFIIFTTAAVTTTEGLHRPGLYESSLLSRCEPAPC